MVVTHTDQMSIIQNKKGMDDGQKNDSEDNLLAILRRTFIWTSNIGWTGLVICGERKESYRY